MKRPMRLIDPETAARIDRLQIAFNELGVDPYGISKEALARAYSVLRLFYRHYFRVTVHGLQHIPRQGRAMLVGNHSGGVAIDGAIVLASVFFDLDPPRIAHAMAEKFINRLPFLSDWANRTGHFTGLPQHAARLLRDERLLLVFPEGARGTAKLFSQRYSLVQFGTGFMRLALDTRTPIVPFAFLGGGEALPTIMNAYRLGRLVGVPYLPITPYLLPLPLPVRMQLRYGAPLEFSGSGNQDDDVINRYVQQVRERVAALIGQGRQEESS